MAETKETAPVAPIAPEYLFALTHNRAPVAKPAEEEKGVLSLETAVPNVIKKASFHDGLYPGLIRVGVCKGLHESCKAIDRGTALMCFLAKNCDEPNYPTLVSALCKMRGVKLIHVPDNKVLGQWAGLCKFDKTGEARKIVRTSVVVITV